MGDLQVSPLLMVIAAIPLHWGRVALYSQQAPREQIAPEQLTRGQLAQVLDVVGRLGWVWEDEHHLSPRQEEQEEEEVILCLPHLKRKSCGLLKKI